MELRKNEMILFIINFKILRRINSDQIIWFKVMID